MSEAKSRISSRSRSNVTAKEAAQKWEERRKKRYADIQLQMDLAKTTSKSISTRREASTVIIAYENCIRLLEKQIYDNERCPNVAKRIKYIKEDQQLVNEIENKIGRAHV